MLQLYLLILYEKKMPQITDINADLHFTLAAICPSIKQNI